MRLCHILSYGGKNKISMSSSATVKWNYKMEDVGLRDKRASDHRGSHDCDLSDDEGNTDRPPSIE